MNAVSMLYAVVAASLLSHGLFFETAIAQTQRGETMQPREKSSAMVMTVLEGQVEPEKWETLSEAYNAAGSDLPTQIVATFLVQSSSEPKVWRIVTVWRSREALDEYRRSTETPGGVLFFRAAGAEPTLTILDVAASSMNR